LPAVLAIFVATWIFSDIVYLLFITTPERGLIQVLGVFLIGVIGGLRIFTLGGFSVTNEEQLGKYQKITGDIKKMEDLIEKGRKMKSDIAKALLDENGKDFLYDLGGGEKFFVSSTKSRSYFLAPKKRKAKKVREEGKPKAKVPKIRASKAEEKVEEKKVEGKRGRGRPPKPKMAIIDGQLVEVSDKPPAQTTIKEPPKVESKPKGKVIEIQATLRSSSSAVETKLIEAPVGLKTGLTEQQTKVTQPELELQEEEVIPKGEENLEIENDSEESEPLEENPDLLDLEPPEEETEAFFEESEPTSKPAKAAPTETVSPEDAALDAALADLIPEDI
jgi:hypothetical protein